MKFNAVQIAKLIDGLVEGDESVEVNQLAKIEEASTGSLTFLSNPIYTPYIYNTGASIAIVNHNFVPDQKIPETCTLIRVEDAYAAFAKLLAFYQQYQIESKIGIEQPSFIASTAQLGEKVYIGAFAYISEKVILADKVKIYPHAFIGENVTI
ncbi:MAG: LpxD N-terminal domain-containing protein, partial [Flavobacteriales bacterium]